MADGRHTTLLSSTATKPEATRCATHAGPRTSPTSSVRTVSCSEGDANTPEWLIARSQHTVKCRCFGEAFACWSVLACGDFRIGSESDTVLRKEASESDHGHLMLPICVFAVHSHAGCESHFACTSRGQDESHVMCSIRGHATSVHDRSWQTHDSGLHTIVNRR